MINRDCSVPLVAITWAATVFEMNFSLKSSRTCNRRGLVGILLEPHLLHLQAGDFILEFTVLFAMPRRSA